MSVFLYIKIGRDVLALVSNFNGQICLVAKKVCLKWEV